MQNVYIIMASIEGRISPAKPSQSVIAVRGNDSVRVISNDGHFGMELQPGDWKLIFAIQELNSAPTEEKCAGFGRSTPEYGRISLSPIIFIQTAEKHLHQRLFTEMFYHWI